MKCKNFYWVNNWINYIANAGILNFTMVPYLPRFKFIDIKRNRDISTLWFKPCFYWFGATQVETKLSLLISNKDSEPLHTVNLCFSLSGYSKIVRLGCSTLEHFLSVNFSRRINWATKWVKEKKKERKKPPTGSAFSVTAEPANVVFAHPRSGFLLQAECFSNFNVNMLRWRRSSRSSVHQQQVNKSQTNPGPLVPVTLWFPWHFKTLDMFVHVCVYVCVFLIAWIIGGKTCVCCIPGA